jgi:hypothetical protein
MKTRTITKERRQTSHLFHLVMTLITGGLWGLFVWLPITVWHKIGPRSKSVATTYTDPASGLLTDDVELDLHHGAFRSALRGRHDPPAA